MELVQEEIDALGLNISAEEVKGLMALLGDMERFIRRLEVLFVIFSSSVAFQT